MIKKFLELTLGSDEKALFNVEFIYKIRPSNQFYGFNGKYGSDILYGNEYHFVKEDYQTIRQMLAKEGMV